ncbi:hypothetical protein GNF82_12090 [Clostridium perfringens]
MQKVFINKGTNVVEQILPITNIEEYPDNYFEWCYSILDEEDKVKSYDLRYNLDSKCFEKIENYEEFETVVLPSNFERLSEQLVKKEEEILQLKLTIAESSESKDEEILSLKLAMAELVEGSI